MPQINCYIPIKLRLTGRPSDDQLDELSDTLVRALEARIALAEETIGRRNGIRLPSGNSEILQEGYDPSREIESSNGYYVPSYNDQGTLSVIRWKRKRIPRHLKTGILSRAQVRVPTEKVRWLLVHARKAGQPWVKRLIVDLPQVVPEVDVTIELFRVQDATLTSEELTFIFTRYVELRHLNHLQDKKYFVGRWIPVSYKSELENSLGQNLDMLFRKVKLHLPGEMSIEDRQRHVLLVYASFPNSIARYLVPEGVVEAEEAIEIALQQKPIGRLTEILNAPDQFRDKLEGPDNQLVVVLIQESGKEEKKVVSLGVLRRMIDKIEQVKRNPLLHGHFKRMPPPEDAPAEIIQEIISQGRRIQFYSAVREVYIGTDRVTVRRREQWEVINADNINGVIVKPKSETHVFAPEEPVALRIGGSRYDHAPAPEDEIEIIVPAMELGNVIQEVNEALNTQNLIRGTLLQVERLTDAITIYFAIQTGGQLLGAGQASAQLLRQQGLRAGLGLIGRGLLTRQAAVLGGEVALNLVLPALTIWVDANRDELQETSWGRALVTSIDTVNVTLAIYGLGRLTLGAARILKGKLIRVPKAGGIDETLDDAIRELDDLIQKAEQATAGESRALYTTAVGDRGEAIRGLAQGEQNAVLAAAEWNPTLARRAVMAETEQGFQRYTDELAGELKATGMSDEQIHQFRAGLAKLNEQRRTLLTAATEPGLIEQRVAELGLGGELRQEARTMLDELGRRRRELISAGNTRAARAISARMLRMTEWMNQRDFLRLESEALRQAVGASPLLSSVAAKGGGPMLRRLWLMYNAPRRRALKVTFDEYVRILQRHFRGNFGEFEVAFRLSGPYIILKPPDALVTLPGTDLIMMPRGGGDLLLIDNKALNAEQVNAVSALTRNLPKNLNMDINEFAKLSGQSGIPAEFQQALTRLQNARQEINPIIEGMSSKAIAEPVVQQQIDSILQDHGIRRVVSNAGGQVKGLSQDLESIGLELLDLN